MQNYIISKISSQEFIQIDIKTQDFKIFSIKGNIYQIIKFSDNLCLICAGKNLFTFDLNQTKKIEIEGNKFYVRLNIIKEWNVYHTKF